MRVFRHRLGKVILFGGGIALLGIVINWLLIPQNDPIGCYYQHQSEFDDIANYMITHPECSFFINDQNSWPNEIGRQLKQLSRQRIPIVSIHRDAVSPQIIHFAFPIIYEGEDGEHTDIAIIRELIYSEEVLPSHFVYTIESVAGRLMYEESASPFEPTWYMGIYRVY